MYITENILKN